MVDSKSTDKLEILVRGLRDIPDCAKDNVKSFTLDWKPIQGDIFPIIHIEFK